MPKQKPEKRNIARDLVNEMRETLKPFLEQMEKFSEQMEQIGKFANEMVIEINKTPGAILLRVCKGDNEALDIFIKHFIKEYRRYDQLRRQEGTSVWSPDQPRNDFQAEIVFEVMERGKDGKMEIKESYQDCPLTIFPPSILNQIQKYIKEENLREKNISLERSGPFLELIEYKSLDLPLSGEQTRKSKELENNDKNIINISGEDYYLINELTKLTGVSPQTIRNWEKQGLIPRFPRYEEITGYLYIDKTGIKKSLRVFPVKKLTDYLSLIRNIQNRPISDRDKPANHFSSEEILKDLGIIKSTLSWRCQKCGISPLKIKNRHYFSREQFEILKNFKHKKE